MTAFEPDGTLVPDERRAVFAFDQAVDRVGEEAAFLALGPHRQAARYLQHAHSVLDEVRSTMHRIDARVTDPMLKKRARKRLHSIAVRLAQTGLRDVEHVLKSARLLAADPVPQVTGGWATTLRTQTARVTAWGVEKWTGSPLAPIELHSTTAAKHAVTESAEVVRRGQAPPPARRRIRRRVAISGVVAAGIGGAGLAAYGAWNLVVTLLGLG
ncbi:hypothetical protein [Microbacterium album]|uniref:hypothetical protein n=1 Tax=Microbacterium album TaxID=2053191 RepID=UPI001665B8CE|nr:hypothetical protein [Microbacterium album]